MSCAIRRLGLAVLCASVVASGPGCGDDGNGTPQEDAGVDVAPDAKTLSSFTVVIVDTFGPEPFWAPIADALVALDAPDGTRTQLSSDANGRVTFTEVDWSAGDHTISAYKDGYSMWSSVALTEAALAAAVLFDGVPSIGIWRMVSDLPSITVSGTPSGLTDTAHPYYVNVVNTAVASEWNGASSQTFSVTAPKDSAFTLQGLEVLVADLPSGHGYTMDFYRIAHQPMAASSTDLTGVVVDFATNEMETHTANLTWTLPTRAESPLRDAYSIFHVISKASMYTHGFAQHVDLSADHNQVEVTAIWTEPAYAATNSSLFLRLWKRNTSNKLLALVQVPGYPTTGMALPAVLDVPEIQAGDVTIPIADGVTWTLPDSIATDNGVDVGTRAAVHWRVTGARNSTSLKFPMPPTGVDLAQVLPATPQLYAWRIENLASGAIRASASADYFLAY